MDLADRFVVQLEKELTRIDADGNRGRFDDLKLNDFVRAILGSFG